MPLQVNTNNRHGRNFPEAYVFIEENTYREDYLGKGKGQGGGQVDSSAVALIYPTKEDRENGVRPIYRLWVQFKHVPKDYDDMVKQAYKELKKHEKMAGAIEVD